VTLDVSVAGPYEDAGCVVLPAEDTTTPKVLQDGAGLIALAASVGALNWCKLAGCKNSNTSRRMTLAKEQLNQLGDNGWELVAVTFYSDPISQMIFIRPKP
jgi:hypothetical protein